MTDKELLQQALEALEVETAWAGPTPKGAATIAALQERLARQEQPEWADEARVELVTAIHSITSDYENALGAFGDDDEARRKAEGDIAHARKVAARWNWNGTRKPARQEQEPCVYCGEPQVPGMVHRTDGSCYIAKPARQEQEFAPATQTDGDPKLDANSAREEPVAWVKLKDGEITHAELSDGSGVDMDLTGWTPLYTAPPARQWQGLTDDEIIDFSRAECGDMRWPSTALNIARAIEAALKEKNHGSR